MTDYTKLIERLNKIPVSVADWKTVEETVAAFGALQEQIAILDGTIESRDRNITALQAENERLKEEAKQWQSLSELSLGMAEAHSKERDALQSRLDAMGKGEAVAPKQVECAWRAGWAACRDSEYVGQEAEDEAWGMSETCANADWESAAPKALAPEPLTDDFLQPNDYRLLHRFIETTEDSEGYDITKTEIKRLADLGVVQSHGFGRYSATMFGYWVQDRYWEQNPSLPLKTNSDRDTEDAHGIHAKGGQHEDA